MSGDCLRLLADICLTVLHANRNHETANKGQPEVGVDDTSRISQNINVHEKVQGNLQLAFTFIVKYPSSNCQWL